ncbi:probable mediator of RNA polymerase II transcription subunit 26a [Brachypodium distachyon]|uniref:TFIIS N-terminal domain-containing protein n=1 Tax=Brachypodium distachyon TaxID=15368 RepID=I1HJE9_BRADI|nr:probable mediator of RNA polymerase II transcription subunit 26a [Brachypodium distachyon]KQK06255.1 hypothetical protein BRADI_2g25350v3 [Brachypodium distachyon]|eukprot:XP_003568450.1 probable mediator of RNA polymerase II transcription subunit 26a [Brachypodium distachyon]
MSDGLDRWRDFFRGAGVGICEVIEKAILVAAADQPEEFLRRRDRIAERLFNAVLATRPSSHGCTGSTLSVLPATPAVVEDKGSVRRVPEKESKVDSSSLGAPGRGLPLPNHEVEDSDSDSEDDERLRRAAACNYGHNYDDDNEEEEEEQAAATQEEDGHPEDDHAAADELEALTNEMDEESQIVREVLRIKELLLHKQDHSDSTLFESLRRLQLMQLSVSTLQATEIGRAVNGLRKHNSQQIRHLVQTLIQDWKILVDEWVMTTVALTDNSPLTSNPSVVDDEDEEQGLPSPPLDEGAFFAPETTAIQLSEFFDEMDEDGNLRHNNDARPGNKRENNGRRPANISAVAKPELTRPVGTAERVQVRKPELTRQSPSMRQANQQKSQSSSLQAKPHGMLNKQSRPPGSESGSVRPIRAAPQQKPVGEMKYKQTQDHFAVERKPAMGRVDKSRPPVQSSAGVRLESAKPKTYDGLESNGRLEVAKRKLQERYQEAENAKKQRTIQVMELGDIPKPKNHNRQPIMKSRNNIRSRANGRR